MVYMIGKLVYLIPNRPDIKFDVCLCAKFQVNSRESHIHVVKYIFKSPKCITKLDLWHHQMDNFDLTIYLNFCFTSCINDRKSTRGTFQFLGYALVVSWSNKKKIQW